jgi:NAD(P)-dependent dehydrogenase (short-subunit alcohol dehydrogenase family)
VPSRLLEGDTALVTGAARGIGRGIADALEAEGARASADVEQADRFSNRETRLADEAIRRLGKVSIFVHAASPRRQETQTLCAPRMMSGGRCSVTSMRASSGRSSAGT